MKRVSVLILLAGLVAGSNASVSRVLSMGKSDAFFMDETSVFRNPANVSVYPNMLMGSMGEYRILAEDTAGEYAALNRTNRDPRDGFFGAILSYSFKQSDEQGSQYPMLSFGAVFNRRDPMLNYLGGEIVQKLNDTTTRKITFAEPIGKVDVLAGYALPNGAKLGVGAYLAFQRESGESDVDTRQTSFARGTLGLNWPVNRSMDLEASLGLGSRTEVGTETITTPSDTTVDSIAVSKNDLNIDADVRLFSAMTVLNGDFVPHLGVKWMQSYQGQAYSLDVALGVGLNVNIDKGFFWAGLEALYGQSEDTNSTSKTGVGGRVSFGIERNVMWDWFVMRVGCTKTIKYVTVGKDVAYWEQNAEHDADDDLVGFGIGLNLENRLKFDILVAEDVVYTLTNLLSGPEHHVFTRIDATYSF